MPTMTLTTATVVIPFVKPNCSTPYLVKEFTDAMMERVFKLSRDAERFSNIDRKAHSLFTLAALVRDASRTHSSVTIRQDDTVADHQGWSWWGIRVEDDGATISISPEFMVVITARITAW